MYKWRALKVISRGVEDELNRQRIFEEFKNLMADKEDITITPNILHKEVEINKSEDAVFEILNKGKTIKKLIGIKLQCFKNKSQIKLKSSNFTKELQIRPNELVKFDFECLGKYIGVSEEICVFEFENFLICKVVRLNVVISEKMDSLLSCNYSTVIQVKSKEKLVRDNTSGTVLHGPKPWQRPKFAPLRRKEFFEVPKKLWDIIEEESEFEEKNTIVANLEEYAPCLKTDLSSSNYVNR